MAKKRIVKELDETEQTKTRPGKPVAALQAAAAPAKPMKAKSNEPAGASAPNGNGHGNGEGDKANSSPELGPIAEDDLRKVKTGLSKRDLEQYRQLLLDKRAEILGDVASLQTDSRNNSGGNLSNMPLHMADVGSDNYEQEFTLGLVESERKLLKEINEALLRMKRGIYGVCLEKGVPIGKPRLDAKPWAKYCIAVAREMERRGQTG